MEKVQNSGLPRHRTLERMSGTFYHWCHTVFLEGSSSSSSSYSSFESVCHIYILNYVIIHISPKGPQTETRPPESGWGLDVVVVQLLGNSPKQQLGI